MAPKAGLLLLLWWNLTLVVYGVESFCNLTCSTDYNVSLNCSCSVSVPTYSVLVQVSCRGDDLEVNGTCEVNSSRPWCVMTPDDFEEVVSIGTQCNATAIYQGDDATVASTESSTWQLSEVVKPPPPSDVRVTSTEGFCNITWNHTNREDCLTYRLRMRPSEDASKDPYYFQVMEEKRFLLEQRMLMPHVHYTVDVQAKMCPGNLYEGPWSEWSSPTTECRLSGRDKTEGFKWHLFFVPPSIILLVILALIFLGTKLWKNKIPDPNEFFKPLYGTYGGNFKEWVKPVFSEYEFLRISSQVQLKSEKQQDVAQWKSEKQSFRESEEMTGNGHLFQMLEPSGNSLLYFLEGTTRSEGTGHSAGHISIHTVTLSGEEELGEAVVSESSPSALRGYQDGENFDVFAGDDREQAAFDFEEPQVVGFHRHSGVLPHRENQPSRRDSSVEDLNFPPHVQFIEPERVSLDSFVFNERSDDGYPHVDLDTVDSGFGECGSPGASDSNESEQTDSLHEYKSSNSNYVKQWVVCRTVEEG